MGNQTGKSRKGKKKILLQFFFLKLAKFTETGKSAKVLNIIAYDVSSAAKVCNVEVGGRVVSYFDFLKDNLLCKIKSSSETKYVSCGPKVVLENSHLRIPDEKDQYGEVDILTTLRTIVTLKSKEKKNIHLHLIIAKDIIESGIKELLKDGLGSEDQITLYYICNERPDFILYNAIFDAIPNQCNIFINETEQPHFDVSGDNFKDINVQKIESFLSDKSVYLKLINTFCIFFFQNNNFARQFTDFVANQIRECQGQLICF